jgi:O-antigen ligase
MRSAITSAVWQSTASERLIVLVLTVLIALLAAREALGLTADPLRIIFACLCAVALLILAAQYPAAFIAPVLFIPGVMEVSVVRGLGPAQKLTALQLAAGLLAAGLILRWLADKRHQQNLAIPGSVRASLVHHLRHARRARIGFLIFAGIVALSYTYTEAPNYGGAKLLGFLALGAGLFFASILLFRDERDLRDFTVGTVLFGLLVAASSVSFSATGAIGAGENPAHIGKGQAIGLALLMLMYWRFKNRRVRAAVLLLCVPCLAFGLISAETRGPLFSLLFVLVLSVMAPSMRPPQLTRKETVVVAATIVVSVMLLSAFWFYGTEASRFRSKSNEIVALLQDSSEAQGTAVMRLEYYRASPGIWLQKPLLGWGVGGWSMAYWQRDFIQYPHNLFCEVLTEQGLLGIGSLLYFLCAVFRQMRTDRTEIAQMFPVLMPGLIYLLGLSMFSGSIDDNRFVWFWCGLCLCGCELSLRMKDSQKPEKDQKLDDAARAPAFINFAHSDR